jgi:Protein of unknown function (DUF3307)
VRDDGGGRGDFGGGAVTWLPLLVMLQLKHFVCDFPLQGPYQYLNKGTYGHAGGLLHCAIHLVGSIFVLCFFMHSPMFLILGVEFVVHYHVDWAKMNINKRMRWTPTTSEQFWWLLGFDQLLHQLTYVWMIWMVIG